MPSTISSDHAASYQVLLARDARFDGRLFVGVTSTGIYCRPICRVRTPKPENCRFFDTPAQAEAEKFRPCLKCRPEIAPRNPLAWTVMDASRTLARQAALAPDASLDTKAASGELPRLRDMANKLGVSDRHLRRIFQTEHGVTPVQYLQTRRLLLAKQLLTDTRLPITQVASASGFHSLRRFNAAFAENYRMSPSRLRGEVKEKTSSPTAAPSGTLQVTLSYRPPYDMTRLMKFIAQRAVPGVEAVDGLTIRRTLRAGALDASAPHQSGWIAAEFVPDKARVRLSFSPEWAGASGTVAAAARRWLDLDAAPHTVHAALADLPSDGNGLRLPGSLDGFELAVRAVLGQQVTVGGARTLASRFVQRFGVEVLTPWTDIHRAFPSPESLTDVPIERIAELGIIRSRAGAILALAAAWPALQAAWSTHRGPKALIDSLVALPGIGPWTASYIAMRALSWPDVFLPNDVALLKAMKQLFNTANQREADAYARRWQPWRSYAVLHLWNSLEKTT
ncbi:MAG: helix-turn-helix domain-containing protein [Pseudorhodobacter sp.]|nr:helix-turn-helix domain-containing protein [Rhizobacter sp.]